MELSIGTQGYMFFYEENIPENVCNQLIDLLREGIGGDDRTAIKMVTPKHTVVLSRAMMDKCFFVFENDDD